MANDLNLQIGLDAIPSIEIIKKELTTKIKPALDGHLKLRIDVDTKSIEKQLNNIQNISGKSTVGKTVISEPYKIAHQELEKLYNLRLRYSKLPDPSTEAASFYKKQIEAQQKLYEKSIPKEGTSVFNMEKANELALKRIDLESKLQVQLDKTAQAIIKKYKTEINATNKSSVLNQDFIQTDKMVDRVRILQSRIENAKVSWSKMLSDPAIMARIQEIQKGLTEVGNSKSAIQKLETEFRILSNDIGQAGLKTKSFFDKMAETGERFAAYAVSAFSVQRLVSMLRDAVDAVKELDLSLTELRKVSDLGGDSLSRFVDKAFDVAAEIGRTGKDLVDATTEFKRAGYELESSFEMGKAALVMTNIGDNIKSTEEAASALIAVLRGFKMSESEVMDIVNSINQVSNTAPIAFQDLTEGLRRVSGVMAQQGIDLSKTIGLLTGGFSQLRDIEGVSAGKQKAQYVQKCA